MNIKKAILLSLAMCVPLTIAGVVGFSHTDMVKADKLRLNMAFTNHFLLQEYKNNPKTGLNNDFFKRHQVFENGKTPFGDVEIKQNNTKGYIITLKDIPGGTTCWAVAKNADNPEMFDIAYVDGKKYFERLSKLGYAGVKQDIHSFCDMGDKHEIVLVKN